MSDFIKSINKKRIKCLIYWVLCGVFFAATLVGIWAVLSDTVHLEKWIKAFFGLGMCLCATVCTMFLYRPAKAKYDEEFKKSIFPVTFAYSFPEGKYNSGSITAEELETAGLINGIKKSVIKENFEIASEKFNVSGCFLSCEMGFWGWAFRFDYEKPFKRELKLLRKGTLHAKKPEALAEEGFLPFVFENERFNAAYTAYIPENSDGKSLLCDNITSAFMRITEKTHGKICACFKGKSLYLLISGVGLYYSMPLVAPVSLSKSDAEIFPNVRLAMSLGEDIAAESRIFGQNQ